MTTPEIYPAPSQTIVCRINKCKTYPSIDQFSPLLHKYFYRQRQVIKDLPSLHPSFSLFHTLHLSFVPTTSLLNQTSLAAYGQLNHVSRETSVSGSLPFANTKSGIIPSDVGRQCFPYNKCQMFFKLVDVLHCSQDPGQPFSGSLLKALISLYRFLSTGYKCVL